METAFVVLGGLGFLVLISAGIVIGIYNGIIQNKNRVKRAWADVIAYQTNKLKVVPQLEAGVKQYQEFESGTLRQITELRSALGGLSKENIDMAKLAQVENLSQSLLSGLRVTVEAYPQLKVSELYLKWMKELTELQENITAALAIFNGSVETFNNGIQVFPSSIVNSLFNKEETLNTFSDKSAEKEFEYQPNFTH